MIASTIETGGAAERTCKVCGGTKPLTSEFFSATSSKRPGKRYFAGKCRICEAHAARERWASDPIAADKDRARRDRRRDQIRAYDRMRAQRDHLKKRAQISRWIKANREHVRAYSRALNSRRRALARQVGGVWTQADLARILVAQKWRCWWCSKRLGKHYHADHRIPVAKGGSNDRSNIVAACPRCNQSKNAKMPWEFSGRLL